MNPIEFIQNLTNKVMHNDNVSLVLLVGSFARGDYKPTSDIDLMIVTNQKKELLDNTSFYAEFGKVMKKKIEYYGECTSIRVFYSNGLEVEFGFVNHSWLNVPLDKGTRAVLVDGYSVLYDREGIFPKIVKALDIE